MSDYIKGEKPRDLDGAKGGMVLKRQQNWAKEQGTSHNDEETPMGTGHMGPQDEQNYLKTKAGDGDEVRKGDTKARSMSSLKKSNASAL